MRHGETVIERRKSGGMMMLRKGRVVYREGLKQV